MAMKQTVWVLGHQGMLGHQVLKTFRQHPGYVVHSGWVSKDYGSLLELWTMAPPDIVINCIGVTPRSPDYADQTKVFASNAVHPHRLHAECIRYNARLIHISTDCVFSGDGGEDYSEKHTPDPVDMYGCSKLIGEVDADNALTIRTSLIGHELGGTKRGLLEWFLSQTAPIKGYANAFFSGLTTLEFARVLRDHVVPNPMLHGIFHVGGPSISKRELLKLIAKEYNLRIAVLGEEEPHINRSLDSRRFQLLTGYKPPGWQQMIKEMHDAHA